jgi:acetate kinase
VVHGGTTLTAPVRLTAQTIESIKACIPLAPLHNPSNLAAILALGQLAPNLPQFASFDTAFHATNPTIATTYPIPAAEQAKGLRRYGFHGLSYAGLVQAITPLPSRLLALHLGNGASLCAIRDGKSVATSMGYSPLDGLVMGTRSGAIDGMAVLQLAQDHGIDGANAILNRQSGLTALAGTNDMASILGRNDEAAHFAVDHFCYWAARHAGSAVVAMGGLDAIAFTGGIGENAPGIRDRILAHLAFLGPVPVHIIPADEERQIARDAQSLMERS